MCDRLRLGNSYNDLVLVMAAGMAGLCGIGGLMVFMAAVGLIAWANAQTVREATNCAGLAAGLAVVAAARWWYIARGRRWLTLTADGFKVWHGDDAVAFADTDIVGLGVSAEGKGGNIGRICHLVLDVGPAPARVPLRYEHPAGQVDPLGEFVRRNVVRLTAKALADLPAGGELTGDDWALDRNALTVHGRRADAVHPVGDITAADVAGGYVRVWVGDGLHPAVRIPDSGLNAHVLAWVLTALIAARPPRPADGLGRVVVERPHGGLLTEGVFLLVSGILAAVFAISGVQITADQGRGPLDRAAALVLAIGSPVGWLTYFGLVRGGTLQVRDRGVSLRARELAYVDAEALTYDRHVTAFGWACTAASWVISIFTLMHIPPVCIQVQVRLTFEPRPGRSGRRIRFTTSYQNAADVAEVDRIVEFVGRRLADVMWARLKAGQAIRWGDAEFRPGGLSIPVRLRGEGVRYFVIPYAEIDRWRADKGKCRVYRRGQAEPEFTIKENAPNYYPGIGLLSDILRRYGRPTRP